MEYTSRVSFEVDTPVASQVSRLPTKDDLKVPPAVQKDLNVARSTKANILLVGPERIVGRLLRFAVPDLTQAAMIRRQDGQLRLPPASWNVETIVVRDVDALTSAEQLRLREWLDSGRHRTQIVSTASAPLLSLVETNDFNGALYYRLNTVYIELSD